MVDMLRILLVAGIGRAAVQAAFLASFFLWNIPIMVVPDPIDPLEVDHPLIFPQLYRNPAIPKTRTFFNVLLNRFD